MDHICISAFLFFSICLNSEVSGLEKQFCASIYVLAPLPVCSLSSEAKLSRSLTFLLVFHRVRRTVKKGPP